MKRICLLIVLLCLTLAAATSPAKVQAQLYDNSVGDFASDLFDVIEFYYSIWLGSRNREMVNDALAKIQMDLRPGQTVNVLLIATGPEEHPVFQRAVPEGSNGGVFRSSGEWIVGRITLQGRRHFYSATPESLPIPSRSEFESSIRSSFSSKVTYDDYAFLMTAVNNMIPTSRTAGGYVHDLLDNTAIAGASGTVILTAYDSDSTYRVYDAANNQSDSNSYRKGSIISKMGNTVWVLCRSNAGEYVLVYTDLDRINVSVGDRVQGGSTRIGQWSSRSDTKGFSLYRVHGPDQYFLRSTGYPGPYPILLNH